MATEFTDDQILHAINIALAGGNVDMVPGLITVLAQQNPELAEQTLYTINAGLDVVTAAGGAL